MSVKGTVIRTPFKGVLWQYFLLQQYIELIRQINGRITRLELFRIIKFEHHYFLFHLKIMKLISLV